MSDVLLLKNRYKTIDNLGAVMQAMLVITAAKSQKAKKKFLYASKYLDEFSKLLNCVHSTEAPKPRADKKNLVIVISSSKGMCGGFNETLFRAVRNHLKLTYGSHEAYLLGRAALKIERWVGVKVFAKDVEAVRSPSFLHISEIADKILKWQMSTCGEVFIAYNSYKSMLVQKPNVIKLLPFDGVGSDDYIVEPSASDLYPMLLLHYLESTIYKYIIESELGELNTRMLVVKGATDSSKDMLNELRIRINKARQLAITSELSEIVSSFEALAQGEE